MIYNHPADCTLYNSVAQHWQNDRQYAITRLTAHFTALLNSTDSDTQCTITRLTANFSILLHCIKRMIDNTQSSSWLPTLLFYWTAAAEWSTLYNHQADCPFCYSIGQQQQNDRHYTITKLTAHFAIVLDSTSSVIRMIDNILQITRLTDHFTFLLDSIDRMHDRWYTITRLTAHCIILLHNTDKMINSMQSLGWLPTLLPYLTVLTVIHSAPSPGWLPTLMFYCTALREW